MIFDSMIYTGTYIAGYTFTIQRIESKPSEKEDINTLLLISIKLINLQGDLLSELNLNITDYAVTVF